MKNLTQKRGTGRIVRAGGMTVEYLVTSDTADDALGIYQVTLDARSPGAGPHYHERMTEAFQIHDGRLSMLIDDAPFEAGPGDVVVVTPGTVHAFANRGDAPARFTLTFTPALAREGFFEGMQRLSRADRMDDEAAMLALMAEYDQIPVDGVGGWTQS